MGSVRGITSLVSFGGAPLGAWTIAVAGIAAGCAHRAPPEPPPGAAARAPSAGEEAPDAITDRGARGAALAAAERGALPTLAWARLSEPAPLVKALARVAGMQAAPGDEADVARTLLGRLLGVDPALGAALDLRRSAGIGLLRPEADDEGPPVVALLPVTSREAVVRGAVSAGLLVEKQPFGLVLRAAAPGGPGAPPPPATPPPPTGGTTAAPPGPPASPGAPVPPLGERGPGAQPGDPSDRPDGSERANPAAAPPPLYVAFAGDYAAVAFRADRAPRVAATLAPLLRGAAEAPLSAHVDVARLYETWGAALDGTLARFSRATEGAADPQIAYALRGARRLLRFADTVEGVDLLVGADADGVSITARAVGRPGGAFAAFAASQQSGPPWGLELVPRDAVVTYATRRSAATSAEEVDAAVALVGDSATPPVEAALRLPWRDALARAAQGMSGELVYAVWPAPDGGVGAGGAFRVRSGAATRRDLLIAYRGLGAHLGGAVSRALRLDPERYPLRVRLRPSALRVAGRRADVVEVSVRWPPGSQPTRRQLRRMVGEPLRLLLVFDGERALFALGPDAPVRLSALVAAAAGHGGASLADDPRLRAALAFHPEGRVSLSFLPTAGMARMLGGLLTAGADPAVSTHAAEAALADAGDGAIVCVSNVEGARYEVSTRLPASSLPGLPRIGAVLWRMAISPLLNPPTVPPLPLPPAHLPPPVLPRPSASAPSQHL